MIINNQEEFLDYMLTKHWDDHPSELITRIGNVVRREVSVASAELHSFICYYCYFDEIDVTMVKINHEEMQPIENEPMQIREVVVWCKNGQSNGILFCSYENFIARLKDGTEPNYSLFKWGDPSDDSGPEDRPR